MTEKLYDSNSRLKKFSAVVISCNKDGDRYAVMLDRTAFFPESGGQACDTGTIDGIRVSDVQIKDGGIVHYLDAPIDVGHTVIGMLDWERRFRFMQNHTGEHIISGIVHKLYGYSNIGFHLGSRDVTFDFDGVLTRGQLDEIEYKANKVVTENVSVTAEYPASDVLKKLEYRSKLDLTENVRIVTIDGCDRCACCAPHVNRTGEIGIIKILDFIHYKGGIRIHILCGFDALDDYNERYRNTAAISSLLSAKQSETADAVISLAEDMARQKMKISELKKELINLKLSIMKPTEGNLCLFEPGFDISDLRMLAKGAVLLCGKMCAAFSGNDNDGYIFVCASKTVPMRQKSREISSALTGKCGGDDEMIQGSVKAKRSEIEKYFN